MMNATPAVSETPGYWPPVFLSGVMAPSDQAPQPGFGPAHLILSPSLNA